MIIITVKMIKVTSITTIRTIIMSQQIPEIPNHESAVAWVRSTGRTASMSRQASLQGACHVAPLPADRLLQGARPATWLGAAQWYTGSRRAPQEVPLRAPHLGCRDCVSFRWASIGDQMFLNCSDVSCLGEARLRSKMQCARSCFTAEVCCLPPSLPWASTAE